MKVHHFQLSLHELLTRLQHRHRVFQILGVLGAVLVRHLGERRHEYTLPVARHLTWVAIARIRHIMFEPIEYVVAVLFYVGPQRCFGFHHQHLLHLLLLRPAHAPLFDHLLHLPTPKERISSCHGHDPVQILLVRLEVAKPIPQRGLPFAHVLLADLPELGRGQPREVPGLFVDLQRLLFRFRYVFDRKSFSQWEALGQHPVRNQRYEGQNGPSQHEGPLGKRVHASQICGPGARATCHKPLLHCARADSWEGRACVVWIRTPLLILQELDQKERGNCLQELVV
mmetsp:Transcript_13590/g.30196  ORF Transcript_13590/g.30196 Transcript_13590/m.30196 type:complete len:284 (-) Transcript_13590:112-963(-)